MPSKTAAQKKTAPKGTKAKTRTRSAAKPAAKSVAKSAQLDDCRVTQLSPAALGLMAGFFKVLSEGSRLQIVCALKPGPKNVTEIIEATGLGQANVSKHLKILAQAGVVSRQAQGVCAYYQISNPFIFELCELVCDALSIQIEQQNEQFEQLGVMRQG